MTRRSSLSRKLVKVPLGLIRSIGKPFYYCAGIVVLVLYALTHPLHPRFRIKFFWLFVCVIGAIITFIFLFWLLIVKDLPTPENLTSRSLDVSTKIYDRNGVLLYNMYKSENRSLVSISRVPLHVKLAFLAAEDANFYNHSGLSAKGMTRALIKYLKDGEVTGGSTITQQLVKNALLSSEKTLTRKLKEAILAIRVENYYTKDQIFEMYLNEVGFGGPLYGIAEASKTYFGKDVENLTLSEAALLAGLPKSPTKLSPFGDHPEHAIARRNEVLSQMHSAGFISHADMIAAQEQTPSYAPQRIDILAPHFVMYVRNLLVDKYGEDKVQRGGLSVYTTLDVTVQEMVQEVVKKEAESLVKYHATNAAALVMIPTTGEILAMVGSKDYFDIENDGNVNVLIRLRQPGSSIKPVTYAYALSHGLTPASTVIDAPTSFPVKGQKPYIPKNYDGTYRGAISVRNALAESRNIPAVSVLAKHGLINVIEQGRAMGITTWEHPSDYGLSLTLGGGDVKLIDLAGVYATIAHGGQKTPATSILKIVDAKGTVIHQKGCLSQSRFASSESSCGGESVLDPRVAFQLIDILKDNAARSHAFGSRSALVISNHPEVAVKTGTSNNLKDNVTVGFNQDYLVATWVGNNDSTPMARIASGITGAAPIWNKIMTNLLKDVPSREWSVPEGLVRANACGREEWLLKENSAISCPTPKPSTPSPTP